MKVEVVTIPLDPDTGIFDRSVLEAIEGDVLSISDHFFTWQGVPAIVLVLGVRPPGRSAADGPPTRTPSGEPEVAEGDRALYEALRRWRNDRAKQMGRPAYVLFTNSTLAEVARRRPATVEALSAIPGIGASRVREHGAELVAAVAAGGAAA